MWASGFLLLGNILEAQVLRENEKGEKIIVYPDGTWQYFQDLNQGDTPLPSDQATSNGETTNNYPIFEAHVEPLDGPVSVTEEDIFKISIRRSQLAKEAAQIAEERAEKARLQRLALENDLQQAQRTTPGDANLIKQLNIRLNAAKKTERETNVEARQAMLESNKAEELTEKGNYIAAFNKDQLARKSQAKLIRTRSLAAYASYGDLLPLADNFVGLLPEDNLMINPPEQECKIAFEGKDEYSGMWRKDVQQQLLFTHTDDRLRLYLKEKEYLRCEGFITSLGGGYRFLSLQFTFAYPNAREAYGFIEKGSVLTIHLLNGDYVKLQAGKMDRGRYDTEQELLTYQVHYPMERTQINLLKNSEVDKIRVFWSSGYEEYEVYQLDFFMNQINCLEN